MPSFLINSSHTGINAVLNRSRPVRRTRSELTPVHIGAGKKLDLEAILGISADEALALVESSSDLQRYMQPHGPLLFTQNGKPTHAVKCGDARTKHKDKPVRVEMVLPTRKILGPQAFDASPDDSNVTGIPSAGLDPSLREQISDNVPSTRWSKEQLDAYAKKKGLNTVELSKNATLRKLRGM